MDAVLDKYAKNVTDFLQANHAKGIYSAVARGHDFGASGHCDLINVDGTCVRKCYFDWGDTFIWLDILKLQ